MAGLNSFLKWMVVGILVLIAPWVLFFVVLYFIVKSGFIGKAKRKATMYFRRLGIGDRLFRYKMAKCTSIENNTLRFRYYAISPDAPFAMVTDSTGYKCISAISMKDSAGSPENYRKALSEVLRFLQGSTSQVVMTVAYSGNGGMWNRIQVVTEGEGLSIEDCHRAGARAIDLIKTVSGMVESDVPSIRVKVCKGNDIFNSPLEGIE